MTFAEALRIVLALEGGLVDDPRDPGGVTRHGISLRFLRGVLPGADADTVRSLTLEQARGLYRRHFWQACRCGDMPPGLDLCLFDGAVNQGRGAAARLLQRAVGAVADGAIGPATLTAVRAADPMTLIQDFMARRAKRYAAAPAVATFGRGWFRRLFAIHRRALEEARA